MNILFINSLYHPYIGGGAEIILKNLVEGLYRKGHQVTVLTTGHESGRHEEQVNGIRVIRLGIKNIYWHYDETKVKCWRRFIWHLTDIYNVYMGHLVENIVREIQPDIVNCHNLAGFSSAVWPAIKRAGPPIVQVLHDLYSVCPNSNMFHHGQSCQSQCIKCKIFRIPHKKLSNHVDCVIGVSNYVLQKHITEGYFLHSKIKKYLHNVKPFIYAKNMVFVKNNYITFGFIGNLSKAKGIELLLSSFASIKNKNSAKLIVAGKGNDDYLKYLKIQDLDNVTYIGYVDPIVLFSKIDVLVVPSLWNDTFPSVILESLLYGKPVIGSCLGGIPEIIEDGINGLIFNPNCVFDLRDKIDLLINDNQKLERLKLAAVDSYKDMMDFDEWLESYIRTFSCFLNAY